MGSEQVQEIVKNDSPAIPVSTLGPPSNRAGGFNAGAACSHFAQLIGGKKMQGVVSKSILATIVSLAVVAGIASARSHSAQKTATVEITQSTRVPNGPTLQPGSYKVAVLSDSATPQVGFYQNGKLVGQAPVQVVDQNEKSPLTEVSINTAGDSAVVTEIDIAGWTKKIEFGQAAASESSSGQ